MNVKKYRLVDLFCGCGGLTRGFAETGRFRLVFANDFDGAALESYRANFDVEAVHLTSQDIIELVESNVAVPRADVVVGGPPCQGFSLLNRNRVGDKRRELWRYYLEIVERCGARVVLMENVPQLLGSQEFDEIFAALKELGFNRMIAHILNAANYGVPEIRRRTILLASKDVCVKLPTPTRLAPERVERSGNLLFEVAKPLPWRTVGDVIGDLPRPVGTEIRRDEAPPLDLHFGRTPTPTSLERYRAVPVGGNRFDLQKNRPDITPACWIRKTNGGTDLFGRLWNDRPSVTIRTEFFKPEKGRYLHPTQDRPITHREAARIQSFPDDFVFCGNKSQVARQIGNAVPVLLASALAREVVATLDEKTTFEDVRRSISIYRDWLGEKVKVEYFGGDS